MNDNYVLPHPEKEYWKKHINGMVLDDFKNYIGGNVLDVGCNHGGTTELLLEIEGVESVTAIDTHEMALQVAREKQGIEWLYHDISVDPIKLSDKKGYDTVITFHTLEHIENVEEAIHNIWLSLKRGGNLIVSVPYKHAYDNEFHKHWFDEETFTDIFSKFNIHELYRDQRTDGHGNTHDVLNMWASKK